VLRFLDDCMQLAREVASMTRLLETREREIDSLRQIIEFVNHFAFYSHAETPYYVSLS